MIPAEPEVIGELESVYVNSVVPFRWKVRVLPTTSSSKVSPLAYAVPLPLVARLVSEPETRLTM